MKTITAKERNNGMRYCTFCKPYSVRAIFRTQWRLDHKILFGCHCHKSKVEFEDGPRPIPTTDKCESTFDDRMTEADYQTWWDL